MIEVLGREFGQNLVLKGPTNTLLRSDQTVLCMVSHVRCSRICSANRP